MTSFSSQHTDEQDDGHGTPSYIVEPLADALDGFDLDPAGRPLAERDKAPGAEQYADDVRTKYDDPDGLELSWNGDVWLNPPYGRSENPTWAEKVREEKGNVKTLTCLIASSTSADWFQDTYYDADYLTFIDHRIKFISEDSFAPAGFDSIIASFGDFPDQYVEKLHDMGLVLRPAGE